MNSLTKQLFILILNTLYTLASNQRHLANRFGDTISYETMKIVEDKILKAKNSIEDYDTERWD